MHRRLEPWLGIFERSRPAREGDAGATATPDIVVFDLGRYGRRLVADLHQLGLRVAGFEFDPEVVRNLRQRGIDMRFGDAEDLHLLDTLALANLRWIISTLPQSQITVALLQTLAVQGYRGKTAVAVHQDDDAAAMAASGATHVLDPYRNVVDFAADLVSRSLDQRRSQDAARTRTRSAVAR